MASACICNCYTRAVRCQKPLRIPGETILRQSRFHAHSSRRNLGSSRCLAQNESITTTSSSISKPNSPSNASSNKPEESTSSITSRLRQEAQRMTSGLSQEYMAYGAADHMYQLCSKQADYSVPQALEQDGVIPQTEAGEHLGVGTGWWYSELGLRPIFYTWAQITMLYLYALLVRLRYLPPDEYKLFHQHINNTYFADAEERLIRFHHINLSGIRQRYLKDLYAQWRGLIMAYDEGLIRGDAMLATAIWRNVFNAKEDVDVEAVAAVTSYLRRCLRMLDRMDDDQVRSVAVEWPGLDREKVLVRAESPQLKAPFVRASNV